MLDKITAYVEAHPLPSLLAMGLAALVVLKLHPADLFWLLVILIAIRCCCG